MKQPNAKVDIEQKIRTGNHSVNFGHVAGNVYIAARGLPLILILIGGATMFALGGITAVWFGLARVGAEIRVPEILKPAVAGLMRSVEKSVRSNATSGSSNITVTLNPTSTQTSEIPSVLVTEAQPTTTVQIPSITGQLLCHSTKDRVILRQYPLGPTSIEVDEGDELQAFEKNEKWIHAKVSSAKKAERIGKAGWFNSTTRLIQCDGSFELLPIAPETSILPPTKPTTVIKKFVPTTPAPPRAEPTTAVPPLIPTTSVPPLTELTTAVPQLDITTTPTPIPAITDTHLPTTEVPPPPQASPTLTLEPTATKGTTTIPIGQTFQSNKPNVTGQLVSITWGSNGTATWEFLFRNDSSSDEALAFVMLTIADSSGNSYSTSDISPAGVFGTPLPAGTPLRVFATLSNLPSSGIGKVSVVLGTWGHGPPIFPRFDVSLP